MNSLGDFVVFWNYDFHTVFWTTELSTNSLRYFVVFWNLDSHIVFWTTELSTNSLGDFVVFRNYDYWSELVSLHTSCGHRPSELVSLHTSCGHRPIFAFTNNNCSELR